MAVTLPTLAWKESPNFSSRNGEKVHLIVVHRPVGPYKGSVDFLCRKKTQASAHIITKLGGREATQLVRWDDKAWACVEYNSVSDNLEINDEVWTGHWRRREFVSDDPKGWQVAARIVAFRCHVRHLDPVWTLDPHKPGICRHYDLGVAGGGHTDPTTDARIWRKFVADVQHQHALGGFRARWGR